MPDSAGRQAGQRIQAATLAGLRQRIAWLERLGSAQGGSKAGHLPFGHSAVDAWLPGGGLLLGALHEVASAGPDVEHGASAASFAAGVLARLPGPVLWVLERPDLFAPGLAAVGLHSFRVLYVEAGRPAAVLAIMEEGLRERGLAAVVGEVAGRMTLTATRRLLLAAESSGDRAAADDQGRVFGRSGLDGTATSRPGAAEMATLARSRPAGCRCRPGAGR